CGTGTLACAKVSPLEVASTGRSAGATQSWRRPYSKPLLKYPFVSFQAERGICSKTANAGFLTYSLRSRFGITRLKRDRRYLLEAFVPDVTAALARSPW